MQSIQLTCPQNVVNFCEKRLDVTAFEQEFSQPQPLTLEQISQQLASGDYIPVLKALWSEQDKQRRFEWLRQQEKDLHAPLLFEQAIAEFEVLPTIETIIKTCIPLISIANFRVKQDMQCSKDPSVCKGDAAIRMQNTYNQALAKKAGKNLYKRVCSTIEKNHPQETIDLYQKVTEAAEERKSKNLPNPTWIGFHGMSMFFSNISTPPMHPSEEFKQIREAYADEFIKVNQEGIEMMRQEF